MDKYASVQKYRSGRLHLKLETVFTLDSIGELGEVKGGFLILFQVLFYYLCFYNVTMYILIKILNRIRTKQKRQQLSGKKRFTKM